MSEMIERVAVVIFGEIDQRGEAYKKARAAIAAMREPTDEMVKIGCETYANGDPNDTIMSNGLRDAFNAMIDEALK